MPAATRDATVPVGALPGRVRDRVAVNAAASGQNIWHDGSAIEADPYLEIYPAEGCPSG